MYAEKELLDLITQVTRFRICNSSRKVPCAARVRPFFSLDEIISPLMTVFSYSLQGALGALGASIASHPSSAAAAAAAIRSRRRCTS